MRKLSMEELGRISADEFKQREKTPLVLVLDNVRSALNVGSAFRTADAFLIEKIYLCGITARPPHREILKTALGATDSVAWEYHESTSSVVSKLKEKGTKVYAVEQAENSEMLNTYQYDEKTKCALVFGNEVKGVADEVMEIVDGCLEIPQFGTKHSLNISVSLGIVVWDLFQKILKS